MFEGTLRENIDPVGEHQDVDIWAALEHVRYIYIFVHYASIRLTDFMSSHRTPGSSQVVRREPSRGTRCAGSRGRVIVVGWTTATVVFCTGVVEKGERPGVSALREHVADGLCVIVQGTRAG
jgi:hypothetical protein